LPDSIGLSESIQQGVSQRNPACGTASGTTECQIIWSVAPKFVKHLLDILTVLEHLLKRYLLLLRIFCHENSFPVVSVVKLTVSPPLPAYYGFQQELASEQK
jgi:hypothetical protein